MKQIQQIIQQTQPLSLLYVEDNKQTHKETLEMLSFFFKKITSAMNGQEAIDHMAVEKFDLVITDIKMPHVDGLGLIEHIRKSDLEIPIIIVSAHDETSYFTRTIKFGIDAYLLKPFNIEDITTIFQKVLHLIGMRNELKSYKESLERKVQAQVKELQQQNLLMAQQARLASMGEMINNIAHQWRQPLHRINSCVAVLHSIQAKNSEHQSHLDTKLKMIEENTKYMSDTIEDFSHFFHPDKVQTDFKLKESIEKSLFLIESRLSSVQVSLRVHKSLTIFSYNKEYQQVLLSILHNALDNFQSHQTLEPKIDIDAIERENDVILTIQDNGGGIQEENLQRVFEPYYTTKFKDEGTGLGLYMAKMIIESSMGGTLEVTNQKGGACFTITLPKGYDNHE
jgi:signal transduction histidine kinase